MKSYVFFRYLLRLFALWLGVIAFLFSFIIVLFNTIELLRRSHNYASITIGKILPISLMELPSLLDQLTPFIFLFATMFVLWNLSRRSELIVVRAAGFSIWSILNPLALVAGIYGVLYLVLVNPLVTTLYKESENKTAKIFLQPRELSALSKTGVWLKQGMEGTYSIVHIRTIENEKNFKNITLYNFSSNNEFWNRIDSAEAILTNGGWLLKNSYISESDELIQEMGDYLWHTDLTLDKLQKSLGSPPSISVWELPSFIQLIEKSGFISHEYKLHFYMLILKPLLFLSMVLLGGITAFQGIRRPNGFIFVASGIFMGFGLYLMHHLFYSLGKSSTIPLWIAALAPTLISLFVAIVLLLHLEERAK